jgi:cyclopropane fatty-acyl-phospholipid synthase-like methyltransferase
MLRSSYNRAYFESILFRTTASSQRNRKRLGLILGARAGGELLEIGCGKGHLMQLTSAHFSVTGLDLSEDATRDIEPSFRERIVIADVESYALPLAQYDVIVAFNVFEHLRNPADALRRIAQALKPGGVLVGSVPLNHSLVGRLHTALTNGFDRTHCSTLRLAEWRTAFAAAGFIRQDLFGEIQAGPNHAVYVRNALWPHLGLNLMFVLSAAESGA